MICRITFEQVQAVYQRRIGAGVLRDPGLLEAAVDAPFVEVFGLDPYPTLAQKAGKLLHCIQKAQAYEDGNKRLAWHSVLLFLELNGQSIEDVDAENVDNFVRSLASHSRDGEIVAADWLNDRMVGLV